MHLKRTKWYGITLTLIAILATLNAISQTRSLKERIKVLIVDGQNNHDQWPKTTFMIKTYLEESGLFSVDVVRTAFTWKGEAFLEEYAITGMAAKEALEKPKTDPDFKPKFSKYDVILSNFGWNAAPWPEKTKKALEKYVHKGGGLVVFHAADNSFPKWEAYNLMIGLGGWGDRTEKDGPYVYYTEDDQLVRDPSPGKGGAHGLQHEYVIRLRNPDHPITRGMPQEWLHTKDELYEQLRGPAQNMEILATAFASPEMKGSGRHEPALIVIDYGKGRVFHSILGHADYSVASVGFIVSLLRGTEWAATGTVTQKIPDDFPSKEKSSSRTIEK
ncbi:MAG: ThuA domain-containing protein [Bacteroidota bacterium]